MGCAGLLGLEEVVKSNAGDLGENLNTVSGGERQRINIGRSLLCPFDMLLMDEPTSELDRRWKKPSWILFLKRRRKGRLFILRIS